MISPRLPTRVADALAHPTAGERLIVQAAGIPFAALAWGDPDGRPLLLIHGVTSSSGNWWRLGPALAATGRRAVALDLPGHGRTGHWTGHVRFRDNAADVAAFARAAGLAVEALQVVGHSWGAMTAAALPVAGLRPATLVLLDPPSMSYATALAMTLEPDERRYDDLEEAIRAVRAESPAWDDRDVRAKAEALTQLDVEAARAVLLQNQWDAGLADLAEPAAADIPVWVVRGDPAAGGLVPDAVLPALSARIGSDHVLTIEGGPHSPHRIHPAATTAALLRALGDEDPTG